MKNNKLLAGIALAIFLTSCNNQQAKQSVSEETIAQALDGENVANDTADPQLTTDAQTNEAITDPDGINYQMWRNMIKDIGEFSPALVNELTDAEIRNMILQARELSEETGYWDVKDFVFQELGRNFPDFSAKFPLQSVENRYYQQAAEAGDYLGMFDYERQLIIDLGYPSYNVWAIDDKTVQDAFHEAYERDETLMYEDYVASAGEILFGEEETEEEEELAEATPQTLGSEPASNNRASSNNTRRNAVRRYGSSQTDYDAIKSSLVQYYEFSPSYVNQMTNEDIDIAYTRAMNRMEEEGFGGIGLIYEELGKMYPGASTMYPGDGE